LKVFELKNQRYDSNDDMIATTSVLSHVPQLTRVKSHNKNYTIVIIIVILSTSFLSCRVSSSGKE